MSHFSSSQTYPILSPAHDRFGQEPFIHLKKGTIEEQGQGQGQGQEQEVLAIEYSKEERLTDFTAFHWLITGDPL
jgi:hypothetical protein